MMCHGLYWTHQSHGYGHEGFNVQFEEKLLRSWVFINLQAPDRIENASKKAFSNLRLIYQCLPLMTKMFKNVKQVFQLFRNLLLYSPLCYILFVWKINFHFNWQWVWFQVLLTSLCLTIYKVSLHIFPLKYCIKK